MVALYDEETTPTGDEPRRTRRLTQRPSPHDKGTLLKAAQGVKAAEAVATRRRRELNTAMKAYQDAGGSLAEIARLVDLPRSTVQKRLDRMSEKALKEAVREARRINPR